MRVKQRLNNNVVLVENADQQQMVIMGKGVGYKAYPGNPVNTELIERTFVLKNEDENELEKVSVLVREVPVEYIVLTDTLLRIAEKELHTEFKLPMLVSLADHIYSAVERQKKNIQIVNPLYWDIKQLYPIEAKLGDKAVAMINQEQETTLDKSEATAIAMHFISKSENYDSIQQVMNFTKIISDIISIIQYHFQFEINQESIGFSRLITHLQYFLIRQVKGIRMMSISDEMMSLVIQQYPNSFQCAEKIIKYLNENQQVQTSLEEEIYLTMHIERVRMMEEK